jgi:hypothetical protein
VSSLPRTGESNGPRRASAKLASRGMSNPKLGKNKISQIGSKLNMHALFRRVNSEANLAALRRELANEEVDAFLVPSGDSHQSEYIAPSDKRIKWVSGFSGSSGFAVVTLKKAALWSDGRQVKAFLTSQY